MHDGGVHCLYHRVQPISVMAGWVRSDPAEGQTHGAECQWWADSDRHGSVRQAEWGSAGAPVLFYSPEAESSGAASGRGEAAEKLSPEDDSEPRTSTRGGLQRARISPP